MMVDPRRRIIISAPTKQYIKTLKRNLEKEGYKIIIAKSYSKIIDGTRDGDVCAILIDIEDHYKTTDICTNLRVDHKAKYIPIITLTNLLTKTNRRTDITYSLKCGADACIEKPNRNFKLLLSRIQALIRFRGVFHEFAIMEKLLAEANVTLRDTGYMGTALVITDDAHESDSVMEWLKRGKCRVMPSSSDSAIDTIWGMKRCDLIIISMLLMSDFKAHEIISRIRHENPSVRIPALLLMPENMQEQLPAMLDAGLDDYVLTPLVKEEVYARATELMQWKNYRDTILGKRQEAVEAGVIDKLTKIHNRRYFDARLTKEIEEARTKRSPFSLLVIDVNDFKKINDKDEWGHDIGDEVLIEIAQRVRSAARAVNTAVRYGGDEFAIIASNSTQEDAGEIANRVRDEMKKPIKISVPPYEIGMRVSIGAATYESDDTEASIIKRADKNMYKDKRTTKNAS
jgi:two-component system cell cycle response regulator